MSADATATDPLPGRVPDRRATGWAYCERDADGVVAGEREPACRRCAAAVNEAEKPIVVTDGVGVPDA